MPDALPLRDIHLPADISAWPPAIGWWLLAAALLAAIVWLILYYRRNRVRRAALARLREIHARFDDDQNAQQLVTDISTLLRRVCLTYRPRRNVAALTGAHWRDALAAVTRAQGRFSDDVATQVCDAPYNPAATVDGPDLLAQTRRWVKSLPPLKKAA